MNPFVGVCLAEWRRLGVPEAAAEEMAAHLASDLDSADAEGISAADYLGSSAQDPRAFAASWAVERGLIPPPSAAVPTASRPRALVMLAVLTAVAALVAGLLLATGEPQISLTAHRTAPPHFLMPPGGHLVTPALGQRVHANGAAPVEWILLVVALVAFAFSVWLWRRWTRSSERLTP